MKRIGLIDFDGKIPNLALMKLSTFEKNRGNRVFLNEFSARDVDEVYCSVIFTKNRQKASQLRNIYGDALHFGGTGWDINTVLPDEIENCSPDYDLYTREFLYPRMRGIGTKKTKLRKAEELVNAGIGFLSRGCVRKCAFCVVPEKEGDFQRVASLDDLINPASNRIILLDNNITANPDILDILREIRDRDLVVDISQGIDVRMVTPEVAGLLSQVRHMRSIHYAWDLMSFENSVLSGIKVLSEQVRKYKQMCFMLCGFNTSFSEDYYRFRKLTELGVKPYVMLYNFNEQADRKLKHFARWVNGSIFKSCSFNEYLPWIREQNRLQQPEFSF